MPKPVENLLKRKKTGGKRHKSRGRRAFEKDGFPIEPLVGEPRRKIFRVRGGNIKVSIISDSFANIADKQGKVQRAKILRVKLNPANRDYQRRGVITKGTVIETELGEARVTSKPTDNGVINAKLI
jgi:small subunit ribosomal protein S8e